MPLGKLSPSASPVPTRELPPLWIKGGVATPSAKNPAPPPGAPNPETARFAGRRLKLAKPMDEMTKTKLFVRSNYVTPHFEGAKPLLPPIGQYAVAVPAAEKPQSKYNWRNPLPCNLSYSEHEAWNGTIKKSYELKWDWDQKNPPAPTPMDMFSRPKFGESLEDARERYGEAFLTLDFGLCGYNLRDLQEEFIDFLIGFDSSDKEISRLKDCIKTALTTKTQIEPDLGRDVMRTIIEVLKVIRELSKHLASIPGISPGQDSLKKSLGQLKELIKYTKSFEPEIEAARLEAQKPRRALQEEKILSYVKTIYVNKTGNLSYSEDREHMQAAQNFMYSKPKTDKPSYEEFKARVAQQMTAMKQMFGSDKDDKLRTTIAHGTAPKGDAPDYESNF